MTLIYMSSGIVPYEIPLKNNLRLKRGYPLVFKEYLPDAFVIECPIFDENGYGKSYEEAMADLGSSIVDLWNSLKRLKKRRRNLGECLGRIFDELQASIEPA